MDRATLDGHITAWLARAHHNPNQARTEWDERDVALLPLGKRFSVVRLPERLIHAATGSTNPDEIADTLTARLQGPVIRDTHAIGRPYYPLIQWHAGVVWDSDEETPCLGEGTYMGVPSIRRLSPPGTYWIVPPRREGDLCRPEAVQQLIRQARTAVAVDDVPGVEV
jgi:hypothetical protein